MLYTPVPTGECTYTVLVRTRYPRYSAGIVRHGR